MNHPATGDAGRRGLAGIVITVAAVAVLLLFLVVGYGSAAPAQAPTPAPSPAPAAAGGARPTIVLVHGAWADGSSFADVTQRLQTAGFTVDVPPNPLRGLASDAADLKTYLASVPGPIVLVGHSYGGAVITNAATGNTNIKSLVYIDAYIPDQGESIGQLTAAKPGSALDPNSTFNAVPPDGAGNKDLYVKQPLFPAIFAAGVAPARARVLAAGQRPLAASILGEPSGAPAWKSIPSWAVIGTGDRVLPPAEQDAMTARAKSRVLRINAPHLSMVSDPTAIAAVIGAAAVGR